MKKIIEDIYWRISRFIYKKIYKVNINSNAKMVLGGSIKGGENIYIGSNFFIGKDFLLATYKDDENDLPKLEIGNNVSCQRNVRISCMKSVIIEDNVLLGSTILITDNNHGMNPIINVPYAQQKNSKKDVYIGEGSWIGEQSIVLAGAKIGKKCIIGANSVVNSVIDDYSMAVGTPAKVIKKWDFEKNEWKRLE